MQKGVLTKILHRKINILPLCLKKVKNDNNVASKQIFLVILGDIQGHCLKRATILQEQG